MECENIEIDEAKLKQNTNQLCKERKTREKDKPFHQVEAGENLPHARSEGKP